MTLTTVDKDGNVVQTVNKDQLELTMNQMATGIQNVNTQFAQRLMNTSEAITAAEVLEENAVTEEEKARAIEIKAQAINRQDVVDQQYQTAKKKVVERGIKVGEEKLKAKLQTEIALGAQVYDQFSEEQSDLADQARDGAASRVQFEERGETQT